MNSSLMKFNKSLCLICYEALANENKFSLACGHTFCLACWKLYLGNKTFEGVRGLDASCMQAHCNLKVGHNHFEKLLSSKQLEAYWKWLCKSYTDDNKMIKWCPQ
jgi:ariadne-1